MDYKFNELQIFLGKKQSVVLMIVIDINPSKNKCN